MRLAAQGDPAAFYALFEDMLEQRFRDMVKAGDSHEDAHASLEESAAAAFRAFVIKKPVEKPFEWFAKRIGRDEQSWEAAEETDLESIQSAGEGSCNRSLLMHRLQREYSSLKQSPRRSERRGVGRPTRAGRGVLVFSGAAVCIAAAAAAAVIVFDIALPIEVPFVKNLFWRTADASVASVPRDDSVAAPPDPVNADSAIVDSTNKPSAAAAPAASARPAPSVPVKRTVSAAPASSQRSTSSAPSTPAAASAATPAPAPAAEPAPPTPAASQSEPPPPADGLDDTVSLEEPAARLP